MNRPWPLCFALLLVLCLSSAATAQIRPDSFTFSGILGGYTFDGRQHLETRPVVGLRGGYNFTRYWGIEALVDFVPTEGTRGSGDTNAVRYGAELLLHLLPDSRLVPYLAAGYGGMTLDREGQETTTHGIFSYGPGVAFFLSDDLSLRGDFRHLAFRDQRTLSNYEYTAGITYHFGGTPRTSAQAALPAAPPPPPAAAAEPAAPATPPPVREAPPEQPAAREPEPGRYKYCVTLHLEFDIDRAEIRPEFRDEVAKVGEFMRHNPTTTAIIEGHADEVGSDEYNLELSQRRAAAVVAYLSREFGIEPARVTARGYGKTRPVADNATDAGRQKNRRIEAIIDCALDTVEQKPAERVCIGLRLEFDSGSAALKPEFHDEIGLVAAYMKRHPTTTALIEGHTDASGSPEANQRLSQERADAVVKYLVERFGIDQSRLTAKGFGSTRRIAYNDTPEGRQKNRRINAVIDCAVQ